MPIPPHAIHRGSSPPSLYSSPPARTPSGMGRSTRHRQAPADKTTPASLPLLERFRVAQAGYSIWPGEGGSGLHAPVWASTCCATGSSNSARRPAGSQAQVRGIRCNGFGRQRVRSGGPRQAFPGPAGKIYVEVKTHARVKTGRRRPPGLDSVGQLSPGSPPSHRVGRVAGTSHAGGLVAPSRFKAGSCRFSWAVSLSPPAPLGQLFSQ